MKNVITVTAGIQHYFLNRKKNYKFNGFLFVKSVISGVFPSIINEIEVKFG